MNVGRDAGLAARHTWTCGDRRLTSPAVETSEWRRAWLRRCIGQASQPAETGASTRTEKMARLEAALFVADGAVTTRKLAQQATLADAAEAASLIDRLNELYDAAGTAFRIERVAAGYQMLTRPELAPWLSRLHHRETRLKLSSPSLETLTIIAYRQPVTRADVEAIRGVQSAEVIKQLMDRGLVSIAGEDDSLGRPYLYQTTRLFLESFGLRSVRDLPQADELRTTAETESKVAETAA